MSVRVVLPSGEIVEHPGSGLLVHTTESGALQIFDGRRDMHHPIVVHAPGQWKYAQRDET